MSDKQPTPRVCPVCGGSPTMHAIGGRCECTRATFAATITDLREQVQRLTAERDVAIAQAGTIQHGDDLDD